MGVQLSNLLYHINQFYPVEPTMSSRLARGVSSLLESEKTAQVGVTVILLTATALPTYAIGKRVCQISSAWGRNLPLLVIALAASYVVYNIFVMVIDLPNEREVQRQRLTALTDCFGENRPVEFSLEKLKKMNITNATDLVDRIGEFTAPISILGPMEEDESKKISLFVVLNTKDDENKEEQRVYKISPDFFERSIQLLLVKNEESKQNKVASFKFKDIALADSFKYYDIFNPTNTSIQLCTRSVVASS